MDALRTAEAELTVYVHPSNANRVRHAVNRQLSSLLFTYEDRFDGVLLMHQVTFLKGFDKEGKPIYEEDGGTHKAKHVKGQIMNGLVPYFSVQVHATLLLFSPKPDMILEGKVKMLGKESIHAIVLGVFSVAIMSEDIHEKFEFNTKKKEGKFVSRSAKHHVIKRGSMIRFSVKRVDTEMNCHITGSLIPPHTGCMRWLSGHDTEYASELKSGESTNIKNEQNEQEHRILKNEDGMVKYERPYKSRKRRHIEE